MEIRNSHIMITGASRGIGRAFAKMCAENKAHIHVVLRLEDLGLVKELEGAGANSVRVWFADLASRASIDQFLLQIENTPIDILFNNAGVLTGGLLEEQTQDEIDRALQVNLASLIQLTKAVLPQMIKRGRGKIINNSSVSALMHFPMSSTYAATKAAVWAFTNSLEMELGGTGVDTLLLITPGVKTRMYGEVEDQYGPRLPVPKDPLSPQRYAEMIKEAILNNLKVLEPQGWTGVGLFFARYAPKLFSIAAKSRFKR